MAFGLLFRATLAVGVAASTVSLFAVDPDRDFSGVWRLAGKRGAVSALPSPPADQLTLRQADETLSGEALTAEAEGPERFTFKLDHSASTNVRGEFSRSSVLKWERDALLFNTIANSATASYTEMDRWERSKDGDRMTIRRQVVDRNGQVEALLTYERQ